MLFIIGMAVLAFFLGAALILGLYWLRENSKPPNPASGSFASLIEILIVLATALITGIICAALTVIYLVLPPHLHPIFFRYLLAILCGAMLTAGIALLIHQYRQVEAGKQEHQENEQRKIALAEEERFLTVYADYLEAIRSGNQTQTRQLLETGMPFVDWKRQAGGRFDPRWTQVVVLLRRQDDPQNPLYRLTPLELAAQTGDPDIVALLISYEASDADQYHWHEKAIHAAETARASAAPEFFNCYDQIIAQLKISPSAP